MANTVTIIQEMSSGFIDASLGWDDEGRGFLVVAHAPDETNNNATEADLHIAEDGVDFVKVDTILPVRKITNLKMTHRDVGTDKHQLFVYMTTRHGGTGQVVVDTRVEAWTKNNVWAVAPEQAPAPVPTPRPCVPPQNLPYFGVNDLVTRGQNAKITASAVGLTAPDPTKQTFQDVPVGSTFHPFVEALAQNGHVSGKPCE